MKLRHSLLVAGLALFSASLQAGVVYDQAFDPLNPNIGGNFADGNSALFDNFTLGSNATITQINIWGGYFSAGVEPATSDFRVQIRTGLTIVDIIFDGLVTAASRTDTGIDHNNNGTTNILNFELDVAPLALVAGSYWLGVASQNTPAGENFVWQELDDVNPSGSGLFDGTISVAQNQGDLAFTLSSNAAVPEPATLALFGLGLAGIGAVRRKKQAA